MSLDPELLRKIRKCLALGKSANEHEAAAAIAKARALMDAHGLSDADLSLAEIGEASARASRAQRPPQWENILCFTVRRAMGVKCVIDGGLRVYIGAGPAPEIAAYAFAVLYRKLKAARASYIATSLKRCKAARKRLRADVYCEAWAYAVLDAVSKLAPTKEPHASVDAYLERRFGQLKTVESRWAKSDGRTSADYWNGHAAGRKVQLNHAMNGAAQQMELTHG